MIRIPVEYRIRHPRDIGYGNPAGSISLVRLDGLDGLASGRGLCMCLDLKTIMNTGYKNTARLKSDTLMTQNT